MRNEYERERATLESLVVDLRRQEIDVRRKILQSQQTSDMAGVAIRAAEREFARAQQAWDQRVISERDFQRAQDELDEAKLTHHHAVETAGLEKEGLEFELQTRRLQRDRQQLLVEDLERRVGELAVRSPVDGMVGNLAVTQKAAVQQDARCSPSSTSPRSRSSSASPSPTPGRIGLGMPADVSLRRQDLRRRSERDLARGAPGRSHRARALRARSRPACARTSACRCAS